MKIGLQDQRDARQVFRESSSSSLGLYLQEEEQEEQVCLG
jgi:hypothetical protein